MIQLVRRCSIECLSVILFFSFVCTGSLTAQDVTPRWDDTFSAFGVDGEIHDAVESSDGQLYIAGDFRRVGGLLVNGVARWDGVRWHALGQGIGQSVADVVYTLAFDSDGNLMVGGDFFEVAQSNGNTIEAINLAMWNGDQWEPVASGVNDIVYDLLPDDNGGMYIGGIFSSDGQDEFELNRIAYWDGNAFSSIGDGLGTFGGVEAHALAMDANGTLYAAGTEISGGIFQWDGQNWSAFGARHDGTIFDIVIDGAGQIYAAGDFLSVTQPDETALSVSRIALWNGTQWQALGAGFNQPVHSLLLDGTTLYAGGTFTQSGDGTTDFHYVAQWDGSWSAVGAINEPDAFEGVNTIMQSNEMGLVAAGSMQFIGTSLLNGIGFWNNGAWAGMGGDGVDARIRAMHLSENGDLYIGGDFGFTGNVATSYVAQRIGGVWSALGQGTNGEVSSINRASDGTVYVGGSFTSVFQPDGTELVAYRIARWDGVAWSTMGDGVNSYVESIAIDASDNVYIGGSFTQDGLEQSAINYVAQWNGATWTQVGAGMDEAVFALEIGAGGELIAGGAFTSAGAVANTNNLAVWNNSAWAPLEAGQTFNGEIYALELGADGILTIGGAFTEVAPGAPADHIVQWDGSAWSVLGTALGNGTSTCCVRAIAVDAEGTVFAGGEFLGVRRPAGPDLQANQIASWSADNGWTTLEDGVDGAVRSLAINSEDLFAGGDFFSANGFASSHIARWSSGVSYVSVEDGKGNIPGGIQVTSMYPNPVTQALNIQLDVDRPQTIRVDVYDLLGRKVDQAYDGYVGASGAMSLIIDANHLAAGTYILRVQGETLQATRKFVRTK